MFDSVQLVSFVRSALHAWTVPIDMLPTSWAGKSAEVYFISEHSFMDLRCSKLKTSPVVF